MKKLALSLTALILTIVLLSGMALASAQNAQPALVVVITIDQFRAEALDRNHDKLGQGGFRLFLERGAYFSACNYDYATTFTAPGHTTIFTGTYSMNHGINSNDWWDVQKKKRVSSVEDPNTTLVGPSAAVAGTAGSNIGASPHNLLTDTIGDELKLATGGKAHVFAISLKDRSAIMPGGFSADAAYWIDARTGAYITSSYYMKQLPQWVIDFDSADMAGKYWDKEWKDSAGNLLYKTAKTLPDGREGTFYDIVGRTPYANDYEFEFARALITRERLGAGPVTDLLSISLSANDIVGHKLGPDSPEAAAMVLALDRQIADFVAYLGKQFGLSKVWVVLTSDHGVAPLAKVANDLRVPSAVTPAEEVRTKLNAAIAKKLGAARGDYVRWVEWPLVFVNETAFGDKSEADAEALVGEVLRETQAARRTFTKSQLAAGEDRSDPIARKFEHAYSPLGSWYVLAQVPPFTLDFAGGTTHGSPYSYDTHVPLGFFGLPFKVGVYRNHCEVVDMAPTIASALGINPPASATGRILTEALPAPQQ